jgi:drug/metabolite transporter (DMT)-like permease
MDPRDRRQAAIALGIGLICLVFLLETAIAHRTHPSPASPYVWGGLGTVALLAFGRVLWLRLRRRRDGDPGRR